MTSSCLTIALPSSSCPVTTRLISNATAISFNPGWSWPVSPPSLAHLPNQARSALVLASPDGLQRLSASAAAHRPLHGRVAPPDAPNRSELGRTTRKERV